MHASNDTNRKSCQVHFPVQPSSILSRDLDIEEDGLSKNTNLDENHQSAVGLMRSSKFLKLSPKGKTLKWKNVNFTISNKNSERKILKNAWGQAEEGKLTALMGSSGSGKSSLMSILVGRVKPSKTLSISSKIYLDDKRYDPRDPSDQGIRFVAQDNSLNILSTPRESFRFAGKLQLPKTFTDFEIENIVNYWLDKLSLMECADTMIGNGLKDNLSGGEMKRVSVGLELIGCSASVLLIDEPLSGLDSKTAEDIITCFKKLTSVGVTILFSIHQPSIRILNEIDSIVLLNHGSLMLQCDTSNLQEYLEGIGHPIPELYSATEWMLELAQNDESLIEEAPHNFCKEDISGSTETSEESFERDRVGAFTQLRLLVNREGKNVKRDMKLWTITVVSGAFLSLIYGVILYGVGKEDRENLLNIQGQYGSLVNMLISIMMSNNSTASAKTPQERPVFLREYQSKSYKAGVYFFTHFIAESLQTFFSVFAQVLILYFMFGVRMNFGIYLLINYTAALTVTSLAALFGSIFDNTSIIMALTMPLIVPQFFFSGLFVPIDLLPKLVRWGKYLCSLYYASSLILLHEFGSCKQGELESCKDFIERNEANEKNIWLYVLMLLVLIILPQLAAFFVLKRRANFS